jgi:CrcB protein
VDPLPDSGEDRVFAPPANALAPLRGQGRAFAAVAAGGAVGAMARWLIGLAWPTPAGGFPFATFVINVAGCLLIGALIVVLTDIGAHPLLRPFLATGILGGFTTFSTYAVDAQHLLAGGHVGVALGYLAGTLAAAILAAWTGQALARVVGPGAAGRRATRRRADGGR